MTETPSNTSLALLGFIGLFLLILLTLATLRVSAAFSGKKKPNDFSPTGEDLGPFSRRLVRAHANMYEFFPVYGGVLLFALATGQVAVTNGLALWLLFARIGQTLVHIASTSIMAVQVRFALFLAQFVIGTYWVLKFFSILG